MKKNTKTIKKIQEVGATINPNGIYYDKTGNRAYIKDMDNKSIYISAKKAGGEKEMFYAAAGLRNFVTKYHRRPDEKAWNMILTRAKNAEKSKAIWEKRYQEKGETSKRSKNPFRKKSPELTTRQEDIIVESPKLIDLLNDTKDLEKSKTRKKGRRPDNFEKILSKSIDKGIITKQSAAIRKKKGKHKADERIKELGLNMDPRYLTYYVVNNNPQVRVRIKTINGFQKVMVHANDYENEILMFKAADDIRKKILKTGLAPKMNHSRRSPNFALLKQLPENNPRPSEINPPQKKEDGTWADVIIDEQRVKSKESTFKYTSIFSKIKMWIFG